MSYGNSSGCERYAIGWGGKGINVFMRREADEGSKTSTAIL